MVLGVFGAFRCGCLWIFAGVSTLSGFIFHCISPRCILGHGAFVDGMVVFCRMHFKTALVLFWHTCERCVVCILLLQGLAHLEIEIEIGRMQRIDRDKIICKSCKRINKKELVEDERHVLSCCARLKVKRQILRFKLLKTLMLETNNHSRRSVGLGQ